MRIVSVAGFAVCALAAPSYSYAEEMSSRQITVACYAQAAEVMNSGTQSSPSVRGVGPRRRLTFILTVSQGSRPHEWSVTNSTIDDPSNMLGGSQFTSVEFQPDKNASGYFLSQGGQAVGGLILMSPEAGKTGLPMLLTMYSTPQKFINGRCGTATGAKAIELYDTFLKQPSEISQ